MTSFKGYFTLKQKTYKKAVNGYIPKSVVIPLAQDSIQECKSLVKTGDVVQEGQLIASSDYLPDSAVSNLYSPVPGIVQGIELAPTPDGHYSKALRIKTQGSFSFLGKKKTEVDWKNLSEQDLIHSIEDKGVINTFNTSAPSLLAGQLMNLNKTGGKLLVVRLYDDDVTRITDTLSAKFYLENILEAAEIVAKAGGLKNIVFAADKKFSEKDKIPSDENHSVVFVESKIFPNGFYEQIIKAVKKSCKKSVYSDISKKDIFIDASSLMEVYRTVKFNMPVLDRYIHVSGECIPVSGMVKVCIGTTLRFLAEQCGGFIKEPGVIIINGLLLGYSASSLDAPVTKYVKSVQFLPVYRRPMQHNSECINCGNCRRSCPAGLMPDILYRHVAGGQLASRDFIKSAQLCSNCGLCNLYCPSRLPVSQRILELKQKTLKSEE